LASKCAPKEEQAGLPQLIEASQVNEFFCAFKFIHQLWKAFGFRISQKHDFENGHQIIPASFHDSSSLLNAILQLDHGQASSWV
jgi:hypothetical protein